MMSPPSSTYCLGGTLICVESAVGNHMTCNFFSVTTHTVLYKTSNLLNNAVTECYTSTLIIMECLAFLMIHIMYQVLLIVFLPITSIKPADTGPAMLPFLNLALQLYSPV